MKTFSFIANSFTIIGTIVAIFGLGFGGKTWVSYVAISALIICIITLTITFNTSLKDGKKQVEEIIEENKKSQKDLLDKIDIILEGTSSDTDHDGYEVKTVFLKYDQIDDLHSVLDNYKVIQSKRLFINNIQHEFKWTGSTPPKITSSLQNVGTPTYDKDNNQYDSVILTLKTPLPFNGTATIHAHHELDDPNRKAQPYLCYKVREDQRINLIIFNIVLKNKKPSYNKPALLKRKRISDLGTAEEFTILESVKFDSISKSYFYEVVDPEPGYFYKLEWK